jgi:hypothetical protein
MCLKLVLSPENKIKRVLYIFVTQVFCFFYLLCFLLCLLFEHEHCEYLFTLVLSEILPLKVSLLNFDLGP